MKFRFSVWTVCGTRDDQRRPAAEVDDAEHAPDDLVDRTLELLARGIGVDLDLGRAPRSRIPRPRDRRHTPPGRRSPRRPRRPASTRWRPRDRGRSASTPSDAANAVRSWADVGRAVLVDPPDIEAGPAAALEDEPEQEDEDRAGRRGSRTGPRGRARSPGCSRGSGRDRARIGRSPVSRAALDRSGRGRRLRGSARRTPRSPGSTPRASHRARSAPIVAATSAV